MIVSTIAARYSKAFFELALEHKVVEEAMNDMQLIARTCDSNKQFRTMLKSPVIGAHKKSKILKEIFEKQVSKLTMTYILVITKKRRESFLHEISMAFAEHYYDYKGVLTTYITTATTLTEPVRNEVIELMKKNTKKTIRLIESVNPELVGGYVLNWNDLQFDASISSQINRLKREVAKKNLYVRGF